MHLIKKISFITDRVHSLRNQALFAAASAHSQGPQGFIDDPTIILVFRQTIRNEATEVGALSLRLALRNARPQPDHPHRARFFTNLALQLLLQAGPQRQIRTQETLRQAAASGNPAMLAAVLALPNNPPLRADQETLNTAAGSGNPLVLRMLQQHNAALDAAPGV